MSLDTDKAWMRCSLLLCLLSSQSRSNARDVNKSIHRRKHSCSVMTKLWRLCSIAVRSTPTYSGALKGLWGWVLSSCIKSPRTLPLSGLRFQKIKITLPTPKWSKEPPWPPKSKTWSCESSSRKHTRRRNWDQLWYRDAIGFTMNFCRPKMRNFTIIWWKTKLTQSFIWWGGSDVALVENLTSR